MSKTIKYTGTQDRWPELAITGKQSTWRPGQQEERSDTEAALLIATGFFSGVGLPVRADSVTGAISSTAGQPISVAPVTVSGGLTVGATLVAAASGGWKITSGQWLRDGAAISGATAMSYTIQAADLLKELAFEPTGIPFRVVAGIVAPGGGGQPAGTFGDLRMASIAGMGDSIEEGANASSANLRHLNIVATQLGAAVLNKGVSGTVVQNSNDASGSPRANNMRDRFAADLGGTNKREGLHFFGGFNGARYVGSPVGTKGDFSAANYGIDYRQCLNIALELGYVPEKSVLGTPYWISDNGLNSGSGGFSGQTRSGFEEFVSVQAAAALEYNFYWANVYTAMRDNGGVSLIDTDNIHPKDNGHAVIAAATLAATRPNPRTAPTLALTFPSAGTIGYTIGAVADAVSYTIEYMPAGGGTNYEFIGTVTGASLTGQFTGLTNNFHTVRVRANFAGGLFSGWTPARIRVGNEQQAAFPMSGTAGQGLSVIAPGSFSAQTGYTPSTEPATDATALYATAAASVYRASVPIGQSHAVEGTLVYKSALTNDTVGIAANMSASANTFYFLAYFRADNTLRLYRNFSGNNAVLQSWPMTLNSGSKVIRLTLQVMEGFLRLIPTVDGAALTSPAYVDDLAPLPHGAFGFRFGVAQTSTTGVHLQDLKLYVQVL